MNLRLDQTSIRLRVSYSEATRLASGLELSEQLPFFDEGVLLRIVVCGDRLSIHADRSRNQFDIHLPKVNLEAILHNISKTHRPRSEECEVSDLVNINGRLVEMRFEVDRMSLNKQGDIKK